MKNLFQSTKRKLPTLQQNIVNGKSAERYMAASLTMSLEARVFWASRTEDDSKVDLISIITHPWLTNRVEVLFTQVKSGPTFGLVENGYFKINKYHFKTLLQRNHPTLVCWTLVDFDTPYWFVVKSNARFLKPEYNTSHLLSPASRFDIIRLLNGASTQDGGRGIIFSRRNSRSTYPKDKFLLLRTNAKNCYKLLSVQDLSNPLFGKIEFSRLGWRHITRESRLNIYIVASFEVMKVLEHIIQKTPTKHYILRHQQSPIDGKIYRENEYELEYSNVECYDRSSNSKKKIRVYIKLLEFIAFNEQWRDTANGSNEIERRVVFKSIHYK